MIKYVVGDATEPIGNGPKVIVHCCNDIGGWGAGFVRALSRKWTEPEAQYREWFNGTQPKPHLGEVQFVKVAPTTFTEDGIWVANLIGQRGIGPDHEGKPPIRYNAIREGMERVVVFAITKHASIHMPRMGAGLAGGDWRVIEYILNDVADNMEITVYDLA